jgi:hypothetical protein
MRRVPCVVEVSGGCKGRKWWPGEMTFTAHAAQMDGWAWIERRGGAGRTPRLGSETQIELP